MDLGMHLFAASAPPSRPVRIETMEDVQRFVAVEGPDYLLQALRTLRSHTLDQPLSSIPADLEWIDRNFPKARRGVHPRPDLGQKLGPYQKWRADLRRAVERATGARAARDDLRNRDDAWMPLIAAARLHSTQGGIIHPGSASLVTRLADIARRAGMTPAELADPDAGERLESGMASQRDRAPLRQAMRFLETWRFLPEIGACLPDAPLIEIPRLRDTTALPRHVDAVLAGLAETAASGHDEVAGQDTRKVGDSTHAVYLAALRCHVRTLSTAPDEPEHGFANPARDLDQVKNALGLFAIENIKAGIRRCERREGEPGSPSQISVASYYGTILVILQRSGIDTAPLSKVIGSSRYIREGRELDKGMRPATRKWCEALLSQAERELRFRNLHRIIRAKADEILDRAVAEGRSLTALELSRARAYGVAAAASAIEWAGRPIRLGSVLRLKIRGPGTNFFMPTKHTPAYRFVLAAEDTKAGKEEPETVLRKELHGPEIMNWYLSRIRPLFPHAAESCFLFPAVETATTHLGKGTFDPWFQRAATDAGLPMTFHRWRHGYATLLLDQDFNNLQVAADMLGNTPLVCARNYAWINKAKLYQQGQDVLIARSRKRA